MLDSRHRGLRFLPKHPDVDRNLAPAKQEQPAFFEDLLRDRLGSRLGIGIVVRQKQNPHRKIPLLVKGMAKPCDLRDKQLVGDLRYQPSAIARLGIRIERAAMHQAANRTKPNPENPVRASSAYLRNKAYAT
jgi:hypothetical protein